MRPGLQGGLRTAPGAAGGPAAGRKAPARGSSARSSAGPQSFRGAAARLVGQRRDSRAGRAANRTTRLAAKPAAPNRLPRKYEGGAYKGPLSGRACARRCLAAPFI